MPGDSVLQCSIVCYPPTAITSTVQIIQLPGSRGFNIDIIAMKDDMFSISCRLLYHIGLK